MMYYLIDLHQQTQTPFGSRLDLLTHWRFRLRKRSHYLGEAPLLNFDDLNVTGNDMFATAFSGPWLRRFQVVDEAGRSQDIRTWTKEIAAVNAMSHFPYRRSAPSQTRFRVDPVDMGSKMPLRKGRYSAFTKQRLREACGVPELDFEYDLLGYSPVRDNSRPRNTKTFWKRGYNGSRSWKSNTKNASQWGRHAGRIKKMPCRRDVIDDFDADAMMLELNRLDANPDIPAAAAVSCEI